jgi:rubrerythrin
MMAEEEKQHIRILSEQFKSYQQTSKFLPADYGKDAAGGVAAAVLSSDLREQIQAAGFEAAAVSAAMAMEKNAVALYAKRADESRDAEEQALYRWLSDWEKTHLDFLAAIDREVTEKIWNDNNFWPF